METNQLSKQSTQLPQLSINQILQDKPVKIGSLIHQDYMGVKESIIHVISGHNKNLATFMHLTPDQLNGISDFIINQYSDLSMDCFRLAMMNGMAAKYGEVKRFDGAVIYDWLTKFREEKRQAAMTFKPKTKEDLTKAVPMPVEMFKLKEDLKKAKTINFKTEVDKDEEIEFIYGKRGKKYPKMKPLTPSDLELNAFDIFDFIHRKQAGRHDIKSDGSTAMGIGQRMIEYNGITYTQGSWVNYYVFEINRNEGMIEAFEAYLNTLT